MHWVDENMAKIDEERRKKAIAPYPACMAPDGGECCPQYLELLEKLRRRTIMHYVYLAGPIAGQTVENASSGWRADLAFAIGPCPNIEVLSPMRGKGFLKAEVKGKLEAFNGHSQGVGGIASPRGTMARDFLDIRRSTCLVVGLLADADRVSIGTMIELGYAKAQNKPIILLHDGKDGNVHQHEWIFAIADYQVDNVKDAAAVVKAVCSEGL